MWSFLRNGLPGITRDAWEIEIFYDPIGFTVRVVPQKRGSGDPFLMSEGGEFGVLLLNRKGNFEDGLYSFIGDFHPLDILHKKGLGAGYVARFNCISRSWASALP